MKNSTCTLFILLLFSHLAFAQLTEKTLISSINPDGKRILKIELDSPFEIEQWSGEVIKIQTTVGINHANDAVLKSLVSAGRYKMVSTMEEGSLHLSTPALNKQVSIYGNPITEIISYVIYVPENMTVEIIKGNDFELPLAENDP